MPLPLNLDLSQTQTKWKSIIDPILANPSNSSLILKNIALSIGDNTINHKLGRKLIGWKIIRQRAAAVIYDKQDDNQMPNLTLILNTDADVVVDIEVL